jgi:hypothetical protein
MKTRGICKEHRREDLVPYDLIQSDRLVWGEYRCRWCGVVGYIDWDERDGGPVGEFQIWYDDSGRPCNGRTRGGIPRHFPRVEDVDAHGRDVRRGDRWLPFHRAGDPGPRDTAGPAAGGGS